MNPADIVGAAHRTVLTGNDGDGAQTTTVVVERTFPYSIDDLWDAVTNPERLPRWFAPVTGDLFEGGRYAIEGNASGVITTCTPPEQFALTWEFGGDVSWVTVTLTADGAETALRLEHLARVGDHWRTYGAGATGIGWDLSLYGLGEYLRTGRDIAAEASVEKPGPELIEIIRRSGAAWCDAEVASGASKDDAEVRRDKTIAFFSGE